LKLKKIYFTINYQVINYFDFFYSQRSLRKLPQKILTNFEWAMVDKNPMEVAL